MRRVILSFILVIAMLILSALEIELSRAVDKTRPGTYRRQGLQAWQGRVRKTRLVVLMGLIISIFFI